MATDGREDERKGRLFFRQSSSSFATSSCCANPNPIAPLSVRPHMSLTSLSPSHAVEDFSTIDWVSDTLLERSRRRYEAMTATRTVGATMKAGLWRVSEAAMSWVVVALVGTSASLLFFPKNGF